MSLLHPSPAPSSASLSSPSDDWTPLRRRLRLAVTDLRQVVLTRCAEHPERERLAVALDEAIGDLDVLVESLERPLETLLDDARRAPDPAHRDAAMRQLGTQLTETRARVGTDELVELLDGNGFMELGLRSALHGAIDQLARRAGLPAAPDIPRPRSTERS